MKFDMELSYGSNTLSELLLESIGSMSLDNESNIWVARIKDKCWAPGLWAGCEGLPIVWEWSDAPTERFKVQAVDMEKKTLYLTAYSPQT